MKSFIAAAAFVAVALTTSVATAAGLGISGGNDFVLSNFDLTPTTGLEDGDTIKRFTRYTSGGGIVYGTPTTLKFEYLGSEASHDNTFVDTSGDGHTDVFNNGSSAVGDMYTTVALSDGLLEFEFETEYDVCIFIFCFDIKKEAENDGSIDHGLSIGFFKDADGSLIALFGDGAGDSDMDDMAIRISVVPVPAALPLFGAALIGMGFLARRRKQKAALQA
jgi:hypothetical protein